MNIEEKGLLVLNLGSATLKAARFIGPGFGQMAGRLEVPLDVRTFEPEVVLAEVAQRLGFEEAPAEIGHRIVHGGDAGSARTLDDRELTRLEGLAGLAPLHQRPALALVAQAARLWPRAIQRGAFDTTWHANLPQDTRRLPVPQAWDALGVRRHGFHGLAFASALRLLEGSLPDATQGRVVLAHLGGGASLSAVSGGHCMDTTMSMTPLDGLPMATRSGSLDPGALVFLLRSGTCTLDSLEHALYHDCGMRGISGSTGDVRRLLAAGTPAAKLALDVFALRVAQGVAAMATRIGGIDDLVFSGGIGANAVHVRSSICAHLAWLGVVIDAASNQNNATRLETPASSVRIWRFVVDEEREIADACALARRDYSASGKDR